MAKEISEIKALVVDVNISIRDIIVSMLRALNVNAVFTAKSSAQCFEVLAAEDVDLIICGWVPEQLDALSILKKVRDNEKTVKTSFVIVSSIIEQALIKQAVSSGVSEYLIPPFNQKIFHSRICKALEIPILETASNVKHELNAKRLSPLNNISELSVLAVDDEQSQLDIIRDAIEDNYALQTTNSSTEALDICLSDDPPDLLLLKILMPELDGITLCKKLKENPLTQNIQIIFITVLDKSEDVIKGLHAGAVDYITKPIEPSVLEARLKVHGQTVVNQRESQNQIDALMVQKKQAVSFNHSVTEDIQKIMVSINDCVSELERQASSSKALQAPVSQLKSQLVLSENLVNSRLAFQSISQGTYLTKFTKVDSKELLTPIIESFNTELVDKSLECRMAFLEEQLITCDLMLANVLFSNLMVFAIKHALRGSLISISSYLENDTLMIKLNIVNEIDSARHERFVSKAPKITEEREVFLAYLVAETLNSEIEVENENEQGTTFIVALPI